MQRNPEIYKRILTHTSASLKHPFEKLIAHEILFRKVVVIHETLWLRLVHS